MAKTLKVSELHSSLIDFLIAIIEKRVPSESTYEGWLDNDSFSPTTISSDGQPIMERDWIGVDRPLGGQKTPTWRALINFERTVYVGVPYSHREPFPSVISANGPTQLIAAMRCKVISVFGEEIPKTINHPVLGVFYLRGAGFGRGVDEQ